MAKALALFFGETSPAKGGELSLVEESAAGGEFTFSLLFLSREKNSGFANDLVHGHLCKKDYITAMLKLETRGRY